MNLRHMSKKTIGIVGAGSFGVVVANLVAENAEVILYARDPKVVQEMSEKQSLRGTALHERIHPTQDLKFLVDSCKVIFPIVPSVNFRSLIRKMAEYLHPYHILIHGTKGLDLCLTDGKNIDDIEVLERSDIRTMSEVITEESDVIRVGCLGGPNLARELADKQPAATVVASNFKEVISTGENLLRSKRFRVYGNSDLTGVELCGVLKNIIAIGSGALSGLGLGENARALLISRGMVEMIYLGNALGGDSRSFIGLAGVGDLVATCNSSLSRNFNVGFHLAKGKPLEEVVSQMEETAEGINTIKIAKKLADHYSIRAPITQTLYNVLFENMTVEDGLQYLMKYPFNVDIDYITTVPDKI